MQLKAEMQKTEWKIENIRFGDEIHQKVDFWVGEHLFLMTFSKILRKNDAYLRDRAHRAGFSLPEESYDVKFDRMENVQNETYFEPPEQLLTIRETCELQETLAELLEFHCGETGALVYLAAAERPSLKRFYDRLADRYADQLGYDVYRDLGHKEMEYAIKTQKQRG